MPKEAKQEITEVLGVEPIMINAALVSAQNRKRLFWTNIPGVVQPGDRGIMLKDILEDAATDRAKSFALTGSFQRMTYTGDYLKKNKGQFVYALTETRTEEAKAIRREMQKQGKDFSPRRMKELKPREDGKANNITTGTTKESLVLIVPEATKQGYAVAEDGMSVDLSFPSSMTRRGRVGNKVKNLMTSQNIGVFTQGVVRKLTPVECERLQSLPDGYTEGVSNTQRYKALGNAFNVEVVKHILSFMEQP